MIILNKTKDQTVQTDPKDSKLILKVKSKK